MYVGDLGAREFSVYYISTLTCLGHASICSQMLWL